MESLGKLTIVLGLFLVGCPKTAEKPACSDLNLTAITATCVAEITKACEGFTYDDCPERERLQAQCEKQIDEWEACR